MISRMGFAAVVVVVAVLVLGVGSCAQGIGARGPQKPLVPALILFGDSTVDVGNNNFLNTPARSNFLPYGRDFDTREPTGRFTDGRMVSDYLATWLGLPISLPYLHPNATGQNLVHGINFASAASGYLDTTSQFLHVAPARMQFRMFEGYKVKLANVMGTTEASSTITNALYVVSSGSNDFILNYFISPEMQNRYSTTQFSSLVMSDQKEFVQNLYKAGARKMAILGFPAIGCIPAQITLFGGLEQEKCVETQNAVALEYNKVLQDEVPKWQASLPGSQFLYLDAYSLLYEIFYNPAKYGFTSTRRACCGHGLISTAEFCNEATSGTCSDASKFVFFDSLHPTQSVYKRLADEYIAKFISFFKLDGGY
ncbi:GDSL esterase/lipase At5g03820 [Physcomitrium patens]|uniref:Uncharacterized protein n=1 Tax=Physcomitrium patens TaxID=3218 RepID=A0A2K1J2J8_PHYPA|nr:GDSL esterase/lipase At5g03820-like [Physcomitrium patens]PNR35750.1 hypothetical protein PHYPA_021600 [Physcomitrium patens]|eukprot:XP_024400165.1 GDSL esterase/lipase At5g03820-like [Physcomitrella patens]